MVSQSHLKFCPALQLCLYSVQYCTQEDPVFTVDYSVHTTRYIYCTYRVDVVIAQIKVQVEEVGPALCTIRQKIVLS